MFKSIPSSLLRSPAPGRRPLRTGLGFPRDRARRPFRPVLAPLAAHTYTYDPDGQILDWTRQIGAAPAVTARFGYDAADQLRTALLPTSPTAATTQIYRYDAAGNRTSLQSGDAVTSASHDAGNRLLGLSATGPIRIAGTLNEPADVTVNGRNAPGATPTSFAADVTLPPGQQTVTVRATDGSGNVATRNYRVAVGTGGAERTLSYDEAGNLLDDGAGRTFTWDAANRLRTITQGGAVTGFVYDGLGRRVIETLNGVEQSRWVWGGGSQPAEERTPAGAVAKRFYAGLGEQVGGVAYFYATDHLGSVRELTDTTGAVRARYDYAPFGERTKLSGDRDATFGFTGHLHHASSGLNLTLYRAYDPQLGRWLSRDPIGEEGGINLYGYVGNDPLNYVDPLGLFQFCYHLYRCNR
jgi:RHS repeat-associated protein